MQPGADTMATALKIKETTNQTVWDVLLDNGKRYDATTYPNSNLVFVENKSGRQVNLGAAAMKSVRDAITKAREFHEAA